MNTTNINTGVNSLSNIKGSAKHTAVRIINAMNEDKDPSMCHTFAALTDGAKAIALQACHYSNTYIRGNANSMDATAAAQELEAKAAANVSRKLRKIDHAAAVAFLAEYISRQRNEVAKEITPTTDSAQEYAAILDRYAINRDDKFRYMLLSRMQSDCEYYLGNGNRCEKHLWAGNVQGQITVMRALWHSLPVAPEWLSLEEINGYANEMQNA